MYRANITRGDLLANAKDVEQDPRRSLLRPDMPHNLPQKVQHLIEAGWQHRPQARPSMSEIVAYLTQLCQEGAAD